MKEYVLTELGYFQERECEAIKARMEGYSFMNFHVKWSNCAGNCTLIIETDYEATEAEIKNFFLSCALGTMHETTLSLPKIESLNTAKDFELAYNFIASHLYLTNCNYDFLNGYWYNLKARFIEKSSSDDYYRLLELVTRTENLLLSMASDF